MADLNNSGERGLALFAMKMTSAEFPSAYSVCCMHLCEQPDIFSANVRVHVGETVCARSAHIAVRAS